MRLEAAVDALHLFLTRAGDAELEEFIAVFRDLPTTYEGRGIPEDRVGKPMTTAPRRAALSFAVDRVVHGLLSDRPQRKSHPTFMVVETQQFSPQVLDSRCHAGSWGVSGTESLAEAVARRHSGEVRLCVVQLLSASLYRDGVKFDEERYPVDWAEPGDRVDQSGFASAHE